MTGPAGCHGYAVLGPHGELVGLFEYYFAADGSAAIGLALRPEQAGRGLGESFLQAGIGFLVAKYGYAHPYVYLDVAPTNEPALRLYERVGFEPLGPSDQDSRELRMRKRRPLRDAPRVNQASAGPISGARTTPTRARREARSRASERGVRVSVGPWSGSASPLVGQRRSVRAGVVDTGQECGDRAPVGFDRCPPAGGEPVDRAGAATHERFVDFDVPTTF